MTRWGIIGCGDVTEVKSGPGFQKADGSGLVAVMRRDLAKAQDYARRHGVPRAYDRADALIDDPEVDAVYIATPPSSHCELTLAVAAAGKPCLVEKPMATNHRECLRMIEACAARGVPLWVAYYRRALPRFVLVRDLLAAGAIGHGHLGTRRGHEAAGRRRARQLAVRSGDRGRRPALRPRVALRGPARLLPRPDHRRCRLPDQHRRRLPGRGRDRGGLQLRRPGRGHRDLELQRRIVGRHHDVHRIGRPCWRRRSSATPMSSSPGDASGRCMRSAIRRTCTSR